MRCILLMLANTRITSTSMSLRLGFEYAVSAISAPGFFTAIQGYRVFIGTDPNITII